MAHSYNKHGHLCVTEKVGNKIQGFVLKPQVIRMYPEVMNDEDDEI